MRRPVPWLAIVAVAACLAPAASSASANETIKVISITTWTHKTDALPKGVSVGDTVESRDRLVNAQPQFGLRSGARVGFDHGRFIYTSTDTARYTGEAELPGGTVVVRGDVLVRADGALMIPVVGGSGRYKGAVGFLKVSGDPRPDIYRAQGDVPPCKNCKVHH